MKLLNSKLLEESKYYKFLELPNKTSLNIYNKNLNFRYIHLTILQELKCLTHTRTHARTPLTVFTLFDRNLHL